MRKLFPLIFLLASCGGGGSSSEPSPTVIAPPPSPPPVVDDTLKKPVLTVTQTLASWTESNAHTYRLVYHKEGYKPTPSGYSTINGTERFTESLQTDISLTSGTWVLFVEAYDELGNSLFSDTVLVSY